MNGNEIDYSNWFNHGHLYPTAVYESSGFPRCICSALVLKPVLTYLINTIIYHHICEREKISTRGSGYRDPQSWSYFSQKSKKSHVLLTCFKWFLHRVMHYSQPHARAKLGDSKSCSSFEIQGEANRYFITRYLIILDVTLRTSINFTYFIQIPQV